MIGFRVCGIVQALAGLVEIPAIGTAILIIMKVGKKWFFCSTFIAAGVSCLCVAGLDYQFSNSQNYKIAFLLIGKFTISAGNTIMPVYTAELYPTAIRNAGVGACNLAAGLALIGVPYLPVSVSNVLQRAWMRLPNNTGCHLYSYRSKTAPTT